MTDLDSMVSALKLEVATPGEFAVSFPLTTDSDLTLMLANGFAEAQLEGFFQTAPGVTGGYLLDLDAGTVTPDLPAAGRAMVVLYAADRLLTLRLLGLRQRVLYEAGPVKYEVETSAALLTEMLRQLRQRKVQVVAAAVGVGRAIPGTYTRDSYRERAFEEGWQPYRDMPGSWSWQEYP